MIHDNSQLNAVYKRLEEKGTHGVIKKVVEVDYNKHVISDQIKILDDAFRDFSVSRPV